MGAAAMWIWTFPWLERARKTMTGDYQNQAWKDWDVQPNDPIPVSQSVTTTQPEKVEPTVQEDIGAMQALLNRIVNKAIESTDLAQRVRELTDQVRELREQIDALSEELHKERSDHANTKDQLEHVQAVLSNRETTIHDLMEERDIVVRQRDEARQDRDRHKQDIAQWTQAHDEVFAKLTDTEREKQRLQEQLDAALAKINGFRTAFGALAA